MNNAIGDNVHEWTRYYSDRLYQTSGQTQKILIYGDMAKSQYRRKDEEDKASEDQEDYTAPTTR